MHRAGALFPFATPIPGAMPACHRYWKRCLINEFKKRPQCWGPLVLVNRSVAVGEAARAGGGSGWSSEFLLVFWRTQVLFPIQPLGTSA